MNDGSWDRLRTLFAKAQETLDTERQEFLDRELQDEPELRAELERLLSSSESAGEFLGPAGEDSDLGAIGPYKLMRILGEGGFGVVYLAEQSRPLRRQVALKLIKPGMDTKQVIARFEAERQALAVMDHAGIAHVFDAGETPLGRPYFVMEYVPGLPITAYCDHQRLPIRDRLDLFLRVCEAIQHAHQKGMIHRDIKSSNILVAERDGTASPKIIDFGIAKATGAGVGDRTLATGEGTILGTLGSMSPEQAGAIDANVDTRSDIYSLGVILYELLAGEPPFDPIQLRRATWTDAIRMIREVEPPALSVRITQSSAAETIATRRSTDPRTLIRDVRGDLEWIAMRALEKEPDRRYATASELAADVRRYLANEPVLAAAPSTMYRVKKYARRHRVGVIAAGLVLAAVVAGGIAAGVGFTRAVHAERVARREAESASRVTDFLTELFKSPTPDRSLGETITARTLLDVGALRIQGEKIDDPAVRAHLLSAVGSAYTELGMHDEGLALLRDGVEATRIANGPQSAPFGKALSEYAYQLRAAGQVAEADSLMKHSVDILSRDGKDDPSALAMATLRRGESRLGLGQSVEADSLVSVAIAMLEGQAPPDTSSLIRAYSVRGQIAGQRYHYEQEKQDLLLALSLATAFYGERHSSVLGLHRSLARANAFLGEPDTAIRHADAALDLARTMFPAGHPAVAAALSGRGAALGGAHKWEEAAAAHEEARKAYQTSFKGDHPLVEVELYLCAMAYEYAGRLDLAIERMRESCEMKSRLLGPTNSLTAARLRTLAEMYSRAGEKDRADSLFRAAIPYLDPSRPHEAAAANMGLANVCRDRGRMAEADSLYLRAEALFDTTSAPLLAHYGDCLTQHAYLRSLQGKHAEAESMMQNGIAIQLRVDPQDSPEMLGGYLIWAAARARAGRQDDAIETMQRAVPCGATKDDAAQYPELTALQTRPDYPLAR